MSLYNIPNKRFFIFQSKSREHVCQLAGNKLVFKIIQKYCFYITKFKYHLCYYLNLFAILAKETVW